MERWAGKIAVVTGASAGIGAAIVRELIRHGMVVAGLARRIALIKEIAESEKNSPGKLHAVECDVAQEESVIAAFEWIRDNLGNIDLLVNNAGITIETSLTEGCSKDWRSILDVNVFGLCVCTREALRLMRKSEEGLIIHINSFAGEKVPPIPGFGIYPATKRAVTALAQTLRHELMGTRIRVACISPGLVATGLMAAYSLFSEETLAATPALKAEDVAAAAIFILSTPSHVVVQDIVLRPLNEAW